MTNTNYADLCERLRAREGSDWLAWQAADTIKAQAERIEALEAKCALLAASLAQEEKRSEGLEAQLAETNKALAIPDDALPPNEQEWAKVSPEVAFHLIGRHGENWAHIGQLMEAWRAATSQPAAEVASDNERRYQYLRRRAVMVDCSKEISMVLTLFKDEGPSGEFLDDWIDSAIAAQKEENNG